MVSISPAPRSLSLPCPSHRAQGLTLPEVLVCLALLALLGGAAWPSLRQFLERQRTEAAANHMVAALQRARLEGLRRSGGVVLARLSGPDCPASPAADWSCGWLLFVDDNNDKRWTPGELVLQQYPLQDQTLVRRSVNAVSLSVNRWGHWGALVFSFSFIPPSGSLAASVQLCGSSGGRVRKISGAVQCEPT
ncbi:GspH/FimT family pseudopilin [Curvibacter microcysteis]|uniref:GspH/FimT family pseudopilin n=1 Tax=Curvibacter microcysteis TaxID=3026419 RepID=UPI0039062A29